MSRPLRVEYPGAFYHVMNRGNAGDSIFKSKKDRERFLECLEKCVFRSIPDTHSDSIRTLIPVHSGHPFRLIPDTHSGPFRTPSSEHFDT
jgi:hypothetical protein